MLQISDNIKKARLAKGFSQQEMADKIKEKRSTYANWELDIEPKGSILNKIANILEVSVDDLLSEAFNPAPKTYLKKRQEKKNSEEKSGVPVIGGYTTAGNITVYNDEGLKDEIIATLPPNIFPNCDHAEKAKGDSMYPLIMNQALLVGKKCSPKGIVHGEKYIIKTKDGMDTVKFIHAYRDDDNKKIAGKLLLVAHNKSIPPQELDIEDITFACRVLWIVNPT